MPDGNQKRPYWVAVREVHVQYYKVDDASSGQEAIAVVDQKLREGDELTSGAFEYSHTLGIDTWTVEADIRTNAKR